MRSLLTRRFERSYAAAPDAVRKAASKAIPAPPSKSPAPFAHAKRFPERGPDIWQARINKAWRLYFTIEGDAYALIDMIEHPK